MNTKEREAIIRAQKHGWGVCYVDTGLILLERNFYRIGCRIILALYPDGRLKFADRQN